MGPAQEEGAASAPGVHLAAAASEAEGDAGSGPAQRGRKGGGDESVQEEEEEGAEEVSDSDED